MNVLAATSNLLTHVFEGSTKQTTRLAWVALDALHLPGYEQQLNPRPDTKLNVCFFAMKKQGA
jgi:hypothetical protein